MSDLWFMMFDFSFAVCLRAPARDAPTGRLKK